MANPNPKRKRNRNKNKNKNNGDRVGVELVRRIRIDFRIVPVKGGYLYDESGFGFLIRVCIAAAIRRQTDYYFDIDSEDITINRSRRITDPSVSKNGGKGDPGFVFIRDLKFQNYVPGCDWETKLRNSVHYVLRELHLCRMRDPNLGEEIEFRPFIKPSECSQKMINLLSALPQENPPTIVLKGLPSEYHSMVELRDFFHTLATLRSVDFIDDHVFLQFEDAHQCSKALTRLCSSSLKITMNNGSRIVDYDLNFKDLPDSHITQHVKMKEGSSKTVKGQQDHMHDNMHDLVIRMNLLEDELKLLKAKMEASPTGLF